VRHEVCTHADYCHKRSSHRFHASRTEEIHLGRLAFLFSSASTGVLAINKEVVNQTLAIWQQRSSRLLTDEDAREIAENFVGFFRILHEWSTAETGASQ
jgi:hypothetical protein